MNGRYLLDSHALLWLLTDPARLSGDARTALIERPAEVWFSAVSVYELHYKEFIRKLAPFPSVLESAAAEAGLLELPISARHAYLAGALNTPHRDPFDRILVAQALIEGLTLVTRDGAVIGLDAPTLVC